MSDRKNNLKNLIKKALVSTSMAATFMLTGEAALGGALVNRNVTIEDGADLSSGAGLDTDNGGNPVAFDTASVLTIPGAYTNINAKVDKINAMYLTDSGASMIFSQPITLGVIVPPSLDRANVSLDMIINDGVAVTLNGATITNDQAQNAKAEDGSPNIFAPGLLASNSKANPSIPADTYFINSMDFQDGTGVLNIDTTGAGDGGMVVFAAATTKTAFLNAGKATLNIKTDLQVRDSTVASTGTINISDGATYNFITDDTGDINVQPTGSIINFLGENSTLFISNESGASFKFFSNNPIVGVGIVETHVSTSNTEVALNVGTGIGQGVTEFRTSGLQQTIITGNIFAKTIIIHQNPNKDDTEPVNHNNSYVPPTPGAPQLIWTTAIDTSDGAGTNGLMQFTSNGTADNPQTSEFRANITSDMDVNGSFATITFDDGVNVNGNIINSVGGGATTLNLAGNSTVKGAVGGTNGIGGNNVGSFPINMLSIQGEEDTAVDLNGDITVGTFQLANGGKVAVSGTLTATTEVDFNNTDGMLAFNGIAGPYTFSSLVANQKAGEIVVDTNLTATNPSILQTANILIGQNTLTPNLTLAIPGVSPLVLLPGGNEVNNIAFGIAGATLTIAPPAQQTVTLNGNIDGFAGGGGNVTLDGTNPLTIQGSGNGVGSFGATNAITTLKTIGNVTANAINISNFDNLNITGNGSLTDKSITSSTIPAINIGDNTGASTYLLTPSADFDIATDGIKFGNADSVLNIQSTGDVTATVNGDLDPGAVGSGEIVLTSTGGLLTIANIDDATQNVLGENNTLNNITFAGTGDITVEPTINTANPILTGIAGNLTLNNVNAPIKFTANTNLTVGNVTGQIDLNGNATGVLNVADAGTVVDIINSVAAANNTAGGTVNVGDSDNDGANATSGNISNIALVTIADGGTIGDINSCTTVTFNGAGQANSINGATTVNFNNLGNVILTSDSNANTFNVNNGGIRVTDDKTLTGTVNVGDGEVFANIIGDSFVGKGTIDGNIDGNVTITAGGDNNTTNVISTTITKNVTYNGQGTVKTSSVGGVIDFFGNTGALDINPNGNVGVVQSTGTQGGQVNLFDGATTSTGTITNVIQVNFLGTGTTAAITDTGGIINDGGIFVRGDDTTTATFQGDVTGVATYFGFTSNGTAVMQGNLNVQNVDFQNNAANLTFSGVGPSYTFSSPVADAGAATLNVNTASLTATDSTIGGIQKINIGTPGAASTFIIGASADTLSLLANNGTINLLNAGSNFTLQPQLLQNQPTQTVTFNGNLDGFAGGGGIVNFDGSITELILQGINVAGDPAKIGINNQLNAINIYGNVESSGGNNTLDVSGTQALKIQPGAKFIDAGLKSIDIAAITIGSAAGSAEYGLDITSVGNYNLNTAGVVFGNNASILGIQSSSNADTAITLNGNLDPGNAGGVDGTGIFAVRSLTANVTLTLTGADNLGIPGGNLLNSMLFSGDGNITVIPAINAVNAISTGIAGNLTLSTVNAPINFITETNTSANTNLTVTNVTSQIDLSGTTTGVLNVATNGVVANIINSVAAVNNTATGTVNIGNSANAGENATSGDISNIALINIADGGTTGNISASPTVNFAGGGTSNSITGATAVNFNGAAGQVVTITNASDATNFAITNGGTVNAPAGVTTDNNGVFAVNAGIFNGNVTAGNASVTSGTITGNIEGTATFGGNGTITTTTIGGQTDFAGNAGIVNLNDTGQLGAVINSSNVTLNVGTLNTLGDGTINGPVTNIGTVNIAGGNGTEATFKQDVSTGSLTYNNAGAGSGGTAILQGSLTAAVDFIGNAGGVLQFSGTDAAGYTLNSLINNGNVGTLNVYTTGTTLTANDASVSTLQAINVGQLNAPATFAIDVSQKGLTLGGIININDPGSAFNLTTSVDQNVIFTDNIVGGGGTVNLSSTGNAILTLGGTAGTETLGTQASPLAVLNASGNIGIVGNNLGLGTKKIDVSNTAELNIAAGGVFADASLTSASINKINIGDNTGPATYALDAVNGDFPLIAPGIKFVNSSSVLELLTTGAAGTTGTIKLTNNLDPLAPNNAIVELNAKNAGAKLIIDGNNAGYALGTKINPLKEIKFSGNGEIAVTNINTYAIDVSVTKLGIGIVGADVKFSAPGSTLASVQINANPTFNIAGNVDFQGNASTLILASDPTNNLTATVQGITSTGTAAGTVTAVDDLTVNGTVTNIAMFKGGADNSTVTFNAPDTGNGVTMSVGEIQGTGTGTMVFAQNTNLTGNINKTGGTAVNLIFNSGGSILGNVIGNANNPLGDITILDGTLSLGMPNSTPDSIINGGNIYLGPNAMIDYDSSNVNFAGVFNYTSPVAFNAFNVFAIVNIQGGVRFDDNDPEIVNSPNGYGKVDSPLGVIQINGGDVTFQNQVYVDNVNFTTTNSATLTFNNTTQIGGVNTTGNGIHTIALGSNTTIGNSSVGSASNTLKTIQFIQDVTFTDNSPSVYSTVTSNTPNQGTIIFNADNGFTSDLGDSTNSLKVVQFSSVGGTVKGDTYAQNINIDSGKSAIFSGIKSRSLSVPSSTVGGVSVPRSRTQFSYQTVVSSSDLKGADGTSSAEFTNAALVQTPINGGSYKFDDDVWLQKPVTGTNTLTFAPQKTAFISADLGANNIVADNATLLFVGDNVNIPVQGNISGSNVTFDLGNNTVNYNGGTATPTGNLVFNVFYDTTNAGQTGNTDSGNIVLANGATLDLSNVNSIQINLNAQNNPGGITQGSAYPLITSAGGNIIVGNAANLPFNTKANENVFVRWVITNNSFILYPINVVTDNRILPTIPRVSGTIQNVLNPFLIIPDIIGTTPKTGGSGGNGGYSPYNPTTPSTPLIGDNKPSVGTGGQSPSTGGSGGYSPSTPSTPLIGDNKPSVGTGGQAPAVNTGGSNTGYSPSVPSTGGGNGGYSPSAPSTGGGNGGYSPSAPSTGGDNGGYSPANVNNAPAATGSSNNIGTSGTSPSKGGSSSVGTSPNTGTSSSNGSPASTGVAPNVKGGNANSSASSVGTSPNTGTSSSNGSPTSTGVAPNVKGGNANSSASSVGTSPNTGTSSSNGSPASTGVAPNVKGGNANSSASSVGTSPNTGTSSSNGSPTSTGVAPNVKGGNANSSASSVGTSPNTGTSSSNGSPASTGVAPNVKGGNANSSASSVGTSPNTGTSSSNGSPASTGVAPTNNNAMGNSNSTVNPIGGGNNNSGAMGSGGSPAATGTSKINPNDGFNAAKDDTKVGMGEINKRIKTLKDEEDHDSAVGAGDCDLDSDTVKDVQYGIWTTPYYGRAVQKAMNGLSGYKARSAGGSIGVDTVVNGNVLGAAYTRVDTKLRYQDDKSGNATKVQTNMGSIYGLYRLPDNFFVEGIVTYSRSEIKTNELRNILSGFELAQGKYRSTSYSTEIIGGYSYLWNDNTLSPMAGLRLAKIKDSGYTEQGTIFQNLSIQKRQFNKVEGILGAELKTIFNKGEFSIRPQVHAFINYDFKGKTPAIVAKFDNTEETLPVASSKATKMLYNLGTGVVVEQGRMEYAFHYGLTLAKKYHAQSGTLRLKVNL